MSKERKFTIKPPLLGLNGQPVREVTLNIGTNPPGATGATGFGGATGPAGNPLMQLTSPNGAVWGLTVSNSGVVGTTQVSPPTS
jgi:hypothetical protein